MKKIFIVFLIMSVLFCCETSRQPQEHIAGAFESADVNSKAVMDVVAFVEKELQTDYSGLKIIKTERAQTQVVAGTNFLILCKYKFNGKNKYMLVKIYENLDNIRSITELDMDVNEDANM